MKSGCSNHKLDRKVGIILSLDKFSFHLVYWGGISVPAHNRPDLISIDGWSQQVNDLRMRTQSTGREHARVLLVDKEKQKLFFSGKITAGSSTQTRLDYSTESGREFFQRPIASIHTHPLEQGTMVAHGFSGQDYRTFLGHAEQQAMVIAFGQRNLMMVMKTTATPYNLTRGVVDKRITNCEEEFLFSSNKHPIEQVVDFNNTVCLEMGLTLYVAGSENGDLLTRVNVAK